MPIVPNKVLIEQITKALNVLPNDQRISLAIAHLRATHDLLISPAIDQPPPLQAPPRTTIRAGNTYTFKSIEDAKDAFKEYYRRRLIAYGALQALESALTRCAKYVPDIMPVLRVITVDELYLDFIEVECDIVKHPWHNFRSIITGKGCGGMATVKIYPSSTNKWRGNIGIWDTSSGMLVRGNWDLVSPMILQAHLKTKR